jgi:hypothetical protein
MTKTIPIIAAVTLALSWAQSAGADEITDELDAARSAYDSGDLRKAMQDLQVAVASIQEKINADLLKLLPKPLAGWQADEPQAQSAGIAAMIAGTNLSRRYYRDDGEEVDVSIMADSPLMPMMTLMLSNPMFMQSSPSTKIYTYAGQRGIIEHETDSDKWAISLLVAGKILVKVDGSGLKDKAPVDAYLEAINLGAVEKAFGS